jgi:hypothetical protein
VLDDCGPRDRAGVYEMNEFAGRVSKFDESRCCYVQRKEGYELITITGSHEFDSPSIRADKILTPLLSGTPPTT